MAANNWISTASVDYGTAGNWSDGVPNAADTVALENSNIDIGATLDQSAVALTSFTQYASYTGKIGLHPLGSTPGIAGTYLQIDAATCILGRKPSIGGFYAGSPRIMIDLGTLQACTCRVESTCQVGSESNWGLPPVRLKGVDVAHTLEIWQGHVGVAVNRSDEVSTFNIVTLGRPGERNCSYLGGPGVTINTRMDIVSGVATILHAFPAGNLYGGTTFHNGTGAISGTVTVYPGAQYVWNSTGTAVAITVKAGGKLILNQSQAARTITTLTYDNPDDIVENQAVTITTRTFTGKGGGGFSFGP